MDVDMMSDLELLALYIMNTHIQRWKLSQKNDTISGAEWWVQVKSISNPSTHPSPFLVDQVAPTSEAVDLHYDKDEALATSFGIGSFPLLSSVTYLTDASNTPPTMIFSHRYEDPREAPISTLLVSHPQLGKHVLFDGRLLHGAPAHFALRRWDTERQGSADTTTMTSSSRTNTPSTTTATHRITFLVNLWTHQRPAGVFPLPGFIRLALKTCCESQMIPCCHRETLLRCIADTDKDSFVPVPIDHVTVTSTEIELDGEDSFRGRIVLPFVSKTATWGTDDDDDDEEEEEEGEEEGEEVEMGLTMFPPPRHASHNLMVHLGSGCEALILPVKNHPSFLPNWITNNHGNRSIKTGTFHRLQS